MTCYYEAWSSDGFAAAVGQCVLSLRHMRMSTAVMNECGRIWKKIDHDLF
jgi:bacterioferritin-associated ferredoxin